MRYSFVCLLAFLFAVSSQAINDLPDELRLVRSFEIETNYLAASAETVFSADGRIAASFIQGRSQFTVILWDVITEESILKLEEAGIPEDIAISSDGSKFVLITGATIAVYELESLLEYGSSDLSNYQPILLSSADETELVSSAHFSPDAARIVATTAHNNLLVWNIADNSAFEQNAWIEPILEANTLLEEGLEVLENSPVYFRPDGLYFMVKTNVQRRASSYYLARFNNDFSVELLSPELLPANLNYRQISADGQWLLAFNALEDNFLLQNSSSGETRPIIAADVEEAPRFLQADKGIMREDAAVLLINSENNLRLFDMATGQELAQSSTDGGSFMKLHFISPNLIAVSYQDRVLIYDWIRGS